MMDRELLELAAKAAGYQVDRRASFMTWRDSRRLALLNHQGGHTLWNADEDDGDALRLAVRLKLLDEHAGFTHELAVQMGRIEDPYAATRRAIVRAAAEIGRSMKATQPADQAT